MKWHERTSRMPEKFKLQVYVPEEVMTALEKFSESMHISISASARSVLQEWAKEMERSVSFTYYGNVTFPAGVKDKIDQLSEQLRSLDLEPK